MTQRGELFGESPQACPFIALELDRDRRSDKPDYRHRCFAEPTPQPRAIAHQERYCLSPDFAACPIFQGWAMRAAARPVPVPAGYEGRARSDQPPAVVPPVDPSAAAQPPLPVDLPPVVPEPGEAWPSDTFAPPPEPDAPSQMPAFESASAAVPAAASVPAASPDFVASEPADAPSAWSSSSAGAPSALAGNDPPVPGFLAGRAERPTAGRPSASKPGVPYREQVAREDLVPSWDLTDKYGADVSEHRSAALEGVGGGGGGDRFGGLVTAIAVVAILALGVLGVIFLPGLLGGHGAAPTATPTFVAVLPTGSLTPTLPPGATGSPPVTPQPTAEVSASPSPEATPRLYRIKSTDNSLTQIAHRFHITLSDLLAANPQITNPDHIEIGQLIVVPYPAATPSPSPTA